MCYYILENIYVEVFKELHNISSPEKKIWFCFWLEKSVYNMLETQHYFFLTLRLNVFTLFFSSM